MYRCAPAMLGNRSGFAALMRKEVPNLKITHCFLHRHSLSAKDIAPDLKKTLDICVKVVNFIRSRALNHRLFQSLCEEMGQEHTVLLYHTEVRWLSRGPVLFRVFELRGEIHQFLPLNELNLSLQRRGLNIVTASAKLAAFKEKTCLVDKVCEDEEFGKFPLPGRETVAENSTLHPDFVAKVVEHMQMLRTSFEGYFSCGELQTYDNWILNPFMQNLEDVSGIKEDLIDLRHNREIQMEFTNSQLEHFWASQLEAYPALAKKALEVLLPFATTYLYLSAVCRRNESGMTNMSSLVSPVLQRRMGHNVHSVSCAAHSFSNANLKPSKLDEHFKNKHGGRDAGNDIVTLRVKRARFDQVGTLPTYGFSPTEKPLLCAFL
ncbi:protein FAM200C-like [Tachypleus tridentatus]|uniref:protein FAM200C-like n=1 Tax=Tachypleus tridentatus TaxID=6853 RepID=UPI003FCF3C84